jgi:hypothetical protein
MAGSLSATFRGFEFELTVGEPAPAEVVMLPDSLPTDVPLAKAAGVLSSNENGIFLNLKRELRS